MDIDVNDYFFYYNGGNLAGLVLTNAFNTLNSRFLVQPTLFEATNAKKNGLKIRTVSVRVRLGAPTGAPTGS